MSPPIGHKPQRSWSRAELDRLVELRDERKMAWRDIAPHFPGRTLRQLHSRHYMIARLKRQKGDLPPVVKVPTDSEQERDARLAARSARDFRHLERGDLTPMFFGDPPPGYSALDRRRASA